MSNKNTAIQSDLPATFLMHARALSAWANSVGMTPTQREIHLFVASMLATNNECWISLSALARQIGKTRRGCQKAVSDGTAFFEHDGFDRNADQSTKRLWRLVMLMPSKEELAEFMPSRKGDSQLMVYSSASSGTTNTVSRPLRTERTAPPANDVPQSNNTSPSVRCIGERIVNRSSGGGADQHQRKEPYQNYIENWGRPGTDISSKDKSRHAARKVLTILHQTAKTLVTEEIAHRRIINGSPEWRVLFPPDGSFVYQPNNADIERFLPLVAISVSKGSDFALDALPSLAIWAKQQILLAIESQTKIRDCLRVSAFVNYLSGIPVFQTVEEA